MFDLPARSSLPAAPEPLVEQVLGARAIVLDELREHRVADHRVAGLVALDAVVDRLEHCVADAARERREPDELQVREPRLEHEVGRDRELDRVRGEQQLVGEVARSDRDPVVGVVKLVGPVELRIPAQQLVHEQKRDLGVARLV
ncbi:MAG TPA: hypothetical protein VF516_17175, partial [Kofleriaceae bacterium]